MRLKNPPSEYPVPIYINDSSPYVLKKLKATFNQRNSTYQQVTSNEDSNVFIQWDNYDQIDWDRVLSGELISNSYCTRKGLIRKAQFSYYMRKYYVKRDSIILRQAIPDTIILDLVEDPRGALYEALDAIEEGGLWILKPSVVDKAEIVLVVNNRKTLKKHLKEYPDIKEWVFQQYIERPLLVEGRKFHIRAYVLLVGDLEVYLFEEMLALFAMEDYNVEDVENVFSHITNTCVQFGHQNFDEDRCVKLLKEIQDEMGGEEVYQKVVSDIKDILREVFKGFEQEFSGFLPLPNCFELFGVDFLVSEDHKTYILEFNAGPDLKNTGDRLDFIIEELIEDIVRCTLDKVICKDPENIQAPKKMIKVYEKVGSKWGMPNMNLN
jgi:hypothetical protein